MQIQPADLAYRRRVVRTLVAVAVLLLGAFVTFHFWLWHVSAGMTQAALLLLIARMQLACAALVAVCLGALGLHLLLRGARIVRDRRFPPRDVRAVRATPVREGDAAVKIGRLTLMCGAVCVLLTVIVAIVAWLRLT